MRWLWMVLPCVLLSFPLLTYSADFDGDSRDDIAVFRPTSGLWSVRGVTRVYFGGSGDDPRPGDYNGDGISDIAVFRSTSGLWAIRGITRVYYGSSTDIPIQGGSGQRIYDYVVKSGDGDDLEQALESTVYDSVFIPAGTYTVNDPITVTHVTRITGESRHKVIISFNGTYYLAIGSAATGCTIEKLTVQNGGFTNIGNFFIAASYVTVRDCRSRYSSADGFLYTSAAGGVTFDNCVVEYAAYRGFRGDSTVRTSRLIGCSVFDTGEGVTGSDIGFEDCNNLSNCYVDGEYSGYTGCNNITTSVAYNCSMFGFSGCYGLSSCQVIGAGNTLYGMNSCQNLSACRVDSEVNDYNGCDYYYGSGVHGNSCN